MVLLDTSFLIAYFRKEDVHHASALKWIPRLDEDRPYIPFSVFQELLTVLTYKLSSEEAIQIGDLLLSADSPAQILKLDEGYFKETVGLFRKLIPHRFSYVDVLLIFLHRELEIPVLTFDKKLEKILG